MRRALRENLPCAAMALAASAVLAWLALYGFAWNDYETEAQPAFEALIHGHLIGFLQLVPAYGGSLVMRAPFALVPSLWGGGALAVYRMVALPCLLAGALLGVVLAARMRAAGRPLLWRAIVVALCAANPIALRAIEIGHPEELLGGALCIGAVLLADRDRPLLAGLALGLAIANKEWALLAIGPVLIALPSRRLRCLLSAGAAGGAVLAPIALVHSGGFAASASSVASPTSVIFQPMQVFWFLGHHSASAARVLGAEKHDFRLAPTWIGQLSHPLVIAVGIPLTWLAWPARRGAHALREQSDDARRKILPKALLLLALLLLLRCMLDTWDNVYYPLPFILALLAWESESGQPALLALLSVVLVWTNGWLSLHTSADFQAAFFLLWSLPLACTLGLQLYAPRRAFAFGAHGTRAHQGGAQEMIVKSFSSPLSTS
jgi:hypothetical protein